MYGPACEGTADDIIACEKRWRWFQILKDFNCIVTSTWTNNEDSREFHHTWRAWGLCCRKKQLDYISGPRNFRSETWYLNEVRTRIWENFPVISRVEGQEIRTKKRVKGFAGWTLVSEGEMAKFQEIVLRPRVARDEVALREAEDGERLVHQHDRLVKFKATTTSSRNRKYCVPEEVRQVAADAVKCRDPVKRRCEQNTLTRHIFSCWSAVMAMSHTTLARGVGARHPIHAPCVFDLSLRPSLCTLHLSLPPSTSSS